MSFLKMPRNALWMFRGAIQSRSAGCRYAHFFRNCAEASCMIALP